MNFEPRLHITLSRKTFLSSARRYRLDFRKSTGVEPTDFSLPQLAALRAAVFPKAVLARAAAPR
jgi:hypothetical protein